MKCVVGVFVSRLAAEGAIDALRSWGISERRLSFLTPDATALGEVPVAETEGSGVGMAMGAVVGGAMGLGGGFWLGAVVASSLAHAMDPLFAGLGSALALGIGGAVGGFAAGGALEELLSEGLPKDELLFYEDALRQGRSVVVAAARGRTETNALRLLLDASGAESVDIASQTWWLGLRDRGYAGGAGEPGRMRDAAHAEFEVALDLLKTPPPPRSGSRKVS